MNGNAGTTPATTPNLYVEVDYMCHATEEDRCYRPTAVLAPTVEETFASESLGGSIRLEIFVSDPVPYHRVVAYSSCAIGEDCVSFYDLKQSYFAPTDALRRNHFHYAVFAEQHSKVANCSSGLAEINGNDLIVAAGINCRDFTVGEQLGTFVHELGHNLGLGHNGNEVNDPEGDGNSTVHQSVMNYRYQFGGVACASG